MFDTSSLVELLLWSTLRLSLLVFAVSCVLRLSRVVSPRVHRWLWSAALLQSLILAPWVVSLPVLDLPTATVASPATSALPQISNTRAQPTQLTDAQAQSLDQSIAGGLRPAAWGNPPPRMLIAIWLVGCGAVSVLLAASQWTVWSMLRRAVPARAAWQAQLDGLASQWGLRESVPLRVHHSLGPLLARSPRGYRIIVPRGPWEQLTPGQRQAVLAHELAHLHRGDVWKSLLMRLVAAAHWFNPLAWWAVAKFDEAAEWSCDAVVRQQSDRSAANLAAALLQLTAPSPLVRLGVSSARGNHVGIRVRKLVSSKQDKESKTMKFIALGLAASMLVFGLLRVQLVAQAQTNPPAAASIQQELRALLSTISESEDDLLQDFGETLQSRSGQLILEDHLRRESSAAVQELQANVIDMILDEHFDVTENSARLKTGSEELRERLVAAGKQSQQDMADLLTTCRNLAERLHGDDETTGLVRRFLESNSGATFLYLSVLRDRMQPGMAMFGKSLGKVMAPDTDGTFHIRPDAQERVQAIVDLRETAEKVCGRLHQELASWTGELTPDDEFNQRLKERAQDPLLAALIVAEPLFEKQSVRMSMVHQLLDQLDSLAVDTANGLEIPAESRQEITRLMDRFDAIQARVNVVRQALAEARSKISTSGNLEQEFRRLLETDVALMALSQGTEMANASAEDLVMSVLGEALEQSDGQLTLVKNTDMREKIHEQVQNAMREMRVARRKAGPVRDVAETIDDQELADALRSPGGLLVIKKLAEKKLSDAFHRTYLDWHAEMFSEDAGQLQFRGEHARQLAQDLIDRAQEMDRELSNNDF